MTVLNPVLHDLLRRRFGRVAVSNPGSPMRFTIAKEGRRIRIEQQQGGEQYAVDCPFCGDARQRLVFGHRWLTRPHPDAPMLTQNFHCHNEGCRDPGSPEFYRHFLSGTAMPEFPAQDTEPIITKTLIRMPGGCVPLNQIAPDHPASAFLASKYNGLSAEYLGRWYGACFTDAYDREYPLAHQRIIFPIIQGGELAGWQGRTINPNESIRWIMPRGFRKVWYHADVIGADEVPVIAEGVTSAIACGPRGTCMFGKSVSIQLAQDFASRWSTAIIAMDPETFIPDIRHGGNNRVFAQEVADILSEHCRIPVTLIRWPDRILDLAKMKFDHQAREHEAAVQGREIPPRVVPSIPDPADLGMVAMRDLISDALAKASLGFSQSAATDTRTVHGQGWPRTMAGLQHSVAAARHYGPMTPEDEERAMAAACDDDDYADESVP